MSSTDLFSLCPSPQQTPRIICSNSPGPPPQRTASRYRLEASGGPTVAPNILRGDPEVAHVGRHSPPPVDEPSIYHHAAAYPGAHRHIDEVLEPDARPVFPLTIGGCDAVVFDDGGPVKLFLEALFKQEIIPAV